jgi:hypothetical protein
MFLLTSLVFQTATAGPTVGVDLGAGWAHQPAGADLGLARSVGLHGGYSLPLPVLLTPEVSVELSTFEALGSDPTDSLRPVAGDNLWLIRPTVGFRLQTKGLVRPGVYAHGGYGLSPGYGGSLTGDAGLLFDIAIKKVSFGVHAGYELTGLQWENAAFFDGGVHVNLHL